MNLLRWRRMATVFLALCMVLTLTAIVNADYTTDKGNTVQWLYGDIIVVKDPTGKVLYQGPGTRDHNDRLVPPHHVEAGDTPPNPQNTSNPHTQTSKEGYTKWDGDVPIFNDNGDVVGWGSLYTDPTTGLAKVIINDPVTGHATGDWVRNEYGSDNVVWVPIDGYGGWVCVGCELPNVTWGSGGSSGSGGTYQPPPPPPPVHIGDIEPSTGKTAKRGQAVELTIKTSGPVTRVEVELPAAFKNIPVHYGDGKTEVVANTHTLATAAGGDTWTYRFVLAWTQSRPADGRYDITVKAYGDEGQVSTQKLELTVQGMVNLYSPGG